MATMKPSPTAGTMKAVRIHEYGDASKLRLEEAPRPHLQNDQLLVRIRYAGVNPIDWKIRAGRAKALVQPTFPYTMGQDFAGEVAERAPETESATTRRSDADVAAFGPGQRLFGFGSGTYAEYSAAAIGTVAIIPQSLDFARAAALPTAGSTALQALRDFVKAQSGMRILIHGAAGGVGSLACQIAREQGVEVYGTATGEDLVYLKTLGIAGTIDYKTERFEQKVNGLDAVLDLVGGETQTRSFAALKKGGVLVSTVGIVDEGAAQRAGVRAQAMVMKRSAADLDELANLVNRNVVQPRIGEILNLDQAGNAQEISESGRAMGKILLKVS